jgi:hypothetical protein
MKLQPRQQVLDIWEATARSSFQEDKWLWGGRHGSNSISDAEQLLCLLTPATEVPAFKLDKPDETSDDVLRSLAVLGDSVEIPRLLVRVLTEYMERYSTEDGTPIFSGDSYFQPPDGVGELSDASRALEVADSFSASVTLSLATIGFVRVFRGIITREEIRSEVDALEALASRRLSAAMVGLLRSFTISVFDAHSPEGQALCRTVNQSGLPVRRVIEDLRRELRDINARLRDDITIGVTSPAADLENPNRLFECGWSWGIVRGVPPIETTENVGLQREGFAESKPYLYFTVVALDGIEALFSPRTRLLGLLNEEQTRLSQALQIRWELTQSYWQAIATFGTGDWPLEDIPWRTTDRLESDYFTLLVTSIAVQDLIRRRASDRTLNRVGQVLVELANRARITRRAFEADDPAMHLHAPGLRMDLLGGTDAGDFRLGWAVSDFSPLLLKRTVRIAGLMRDTELRSQLLNLADSVWEHLLNRRIIGQPGLDLWDQPGNVFNQIPRGTDTPSWYYTRRVVECLVTAANDVVSSPPLRNEQLSELVEALLSEAEYRFDQELLRGSTEAGPAMRAALDAVQANLSRIREIIALYPGTALTLAGEVLRDLDRLAAARSDLTGRP